MPAFTPPCPAGLPLSDGTDEGVGLPPVEMTAAHAPAVFTDVGNMIVAGSVCLSAHLEKEPPLVRQTDGPPGAQSPTIPPGIS
ncbi:hypothetical protein GCM10027072_64060 [Streptomyces bullii]